MSEELRKGLVQEGGWVLEAVLLPKAVLSVRVVEKTHVVCQLFTLWWLTVN